ncbi:hypothetical protein F5146DRAFT_1141870 [Armillaria mellea]|nr:hypothetical protein F5146DRAFT_1141870 [Armillaria mellea]
MAGLESSSDTPGDLHMPSAGNRIAGETVAELDRVQIQGMIHDAPAAGPFTFSSDQTFDDYLTTIAATLQCHKLKLILNELKYKQKVPQTSQAHSLTSELAFVAMVEDMHAAKTAAKQIMYILSPALMCLNSDEAWWLMTNKNGKESAPSGFDFLELDWKSTEDSIALQKKKFDDIVKPLIDQLEEKFSNSAGYYFNLDPEVLSSWASHWARGTASEDSPPNNAYFDAKKQLHPHKTSATDSTAVKLVKSSVPMPIPSASTVLNMPFSGNNILEYFLLQQQQQQQFQQMLQMQMLQNMHGLLGHPPSIPSAPPSPAKMPVVLLEMFCAHYEINNTDHDHLQELGYIPGNKDIKALKHVDWNGVSFPALL